jgi:hypothetical protein
VRITFRKHPIRNPQDLDGFEGWEERTAPGAAVVAASVRLLRWSRVGVRERERARGGLGRADM